MKFQCERCKTRYSIADDKVRGKILKIRCKTCSSIVTVRDPTLSTGQAPALSASGSFGAVPSATGSLAFVPRPAPPPPPIPEDEGEPTRLSAPPQPPEDEPPPDEWFISIDGRQEGPFTPEQAQARVARRRGDEEMFAWREDFSEWMPVEDVPLLARHVPKAKPPPPPRMFGDVPVDDDAEPPPHDGMDFNIADASRVVRMPLLAPTVAGKRDGALPGLGSVANGTAPRSALRERSPRESLQLPIAELSRDMPAQEPPRTTTDASVVSPPHKRRRRAFYLMTFGGALLAAGVLVGAITLIGRKAGDDPGGAANDPAPQVVTNFYEKNSILPTTPAVPPPQPGETGAARTPATNGNGNGKGGTRRDLGSRNDPPRIAPATGQTGPGGKVDTFGNEGLRVGPLTPDDVRTTYLANEVMLKRCYERSLKADMSAPVSKMDVKITVDAGGSVTRINVPQESGLAACVSTAIRNWRFRRSTDGLTTEFTVVFAKRG